jgi:hypothetical protein
MAGDITTATGTQFFIGPTPAASVDTAGEYAALTPYVEVGLVETFGEFGDESSDVSFSSVGDSRVRHAKGARDAGTMAVTVGHDPSDAGQLALIAAEATNHNYAFKMIIPDGATTSSTNSIYYFKGLVKSKKLNVGGNDNVIKRMFNIGINSQIFEVPSSTF